MSGFPWQLITISSMNTYYRIKKKKEKSINALHKKTFFLHSLQKLPHNINAIGWFSICKRCIVTKFPKSRWNRFRPMSHSFTKQRVCCIILRFKYLLWSFSILYCCIFTNNPHKYMNEYITITIIFNRHILID